MNWGPSRLAKVKSRPCQISGECEDEANVRGSGKPETVYWEKSPSPKSSGIMWGTKGPSARYGGEDMTELSGLVSGM